MGTEYDNGVETFLKLFLNEQDIGLTCVFGQGAERVIFKGVASIVHVRPRVRNLYCAMDHLEVLLKPKVRPQKNVFKCIS